MTTTSRPKSGAVHATGEVRTIVVEGVFDGARAAELAHTLEAMLGGSDPVVLDFTKVREFYDFGVAVLAHDLALRRTEREPKVSLKGLRTHQLRMFRYFGIDTED